MHRWNSAVQTNRTEKEVGKYQKASFQDTVKQMMLNNSPLVETFAEQFPLKCKFFFYIFKKNVSDVFF